MNMTKISPTKEAQVGNNRPFILFFDGDAIAHISAIHAWNMNMMLAER